MPGLARPRIGYVDTCAGSCRSGNDAPVGQRLFGLHHLALEDAINPGQRPKVDDYEDQLFVVMAHPLKNSDPTRVTIAQLSGFVGH